MSYSQRTIINAISLLETEREETRSDATRPLTVQRICEKMRELDGEIADHARVRSQLQALALQGLVGAWDGGRGTQLKAGEREWFLLPDGRSEIDQLLVDRALSD